MREKLIEILSKELDQFPEGMKHLVLRLESGGVGAPPSIVNALLELPEVVACEGKYYNYGSSRSLFSVPMLAYSVVKRALEQDVENAIDAFFEFIRQDYNLRIQVALVHGLKVERKYEICDGVFISSLDDVPSIKLKEFLSDLPVKNEFESGFFTHYTRPKQLPDAVLYRLTEVRPKMLSLDDDAIFDGDEKGSVFLNSVLKLLTLIGPSPVISLHQFSELHEEELLSVLGNSSGIISYTAMGYYDCHLVTEEEIDSIRLVLIEYFKLNASQREKFDVPLHRLNEAVRHENPIDRAIDLGVALESLLLHGASEKSQLSLQLRLRGAWLLGENAASRKRIYFQLRDLYECRSAATHSGRLTKKVKDNELAEASLKEGLRLCADAIKALIFAKDFQWEDLLLGNGMEKMDAAEDVN